MNTVLFLCSGNYYRSRFAEVVFNSLVAESGIPWQAESRALRISGRNVGPISVHAREGLAERGIELPGDVRFPMLVTETDLQTARRIVALKEAEHRSMIARRFPTWSDRIEFWQIHDTDCAAPADALPELHTAVVKLHDELKGLPG